MDTNDPAQEAAPAPVLPTQPPPPTLVPPTLIPPPTPIPPPTEIPASPTPLVPSEFQEKVDYYYDKGYLSSKTGEYIHLDDFSKDWAKINYDFTQDTGHRADDFMVTAHFEWQSATRHPDAAGCGWAFHKQGEDAYKFLLDKDYLWFLSWDYSSQKMIRFGPSSGNAFVGLDSPGEADVALIVNETKAYVLINDNFQASYTLDLDFLTGKGDLAYLVVSGTNSDYGTRCRMTDVVLWVID